LIASTRSRMPPVWRNSFTTPRAGDASSEDLPVTCTADDVWPIVGGVGKVNALALQASLLELLEVQQHEAELWLQRHHVALRHMVVRTLTGSTNAGALGPSDEAAVRATVPKPTSGASPGSAAATPAGPSLEAVAVTNAGMAEPAAETVAHIAAPKVDATMSAVDVPVPAFTNPGAAKPAAETIAQPLAPKVAAERGTSQKAGSMPGLTHPASTDHVVEASGAGSGGALPAAAASEKPRPSAPPLLNGEGDPDRDPDCVAIATSNSTKRKSSFMVKLKTVDGSMKNGIFGEFVMACLIIANTVMVYVQLEIDGRRANDMLYNIGGKELHQGINAFEVLSYIFAIIFLMELIVNLCLQRCRYFANAFNNFDFAVVVLTILDVFVFPHLSQRDLNVSVLRTMRMLRLARLLRVIRIIDSFRQLRVLIRTIVLSFMSIFWSMLVLFIFMLVSSLLVCQLLQDTIKDDEVNTPTREFANRYYGTSTKALYTFFELTFSGCWPTYARPLIEDVSPWYGVFFILYVTFIVFTLIRIIYALLLKDTMQAAASDADQVIQEKMAQTKQLIRTLEDFFHEADTSGDGHLSREEFDAILAYPKVKTWMHMLGVDTNDQETLYNILDDSSDGRLSYKEFTEGILRMKGEAHKQHLLYTVRDIHRILRHCEALREELALVLPQEKLSSELATRFLPRTSSVGHASQRRRSSSLSSLKPQATTCGQAAQ